MRRRNEGWRTVRSGGAPGLRPAAPARPALATPTAAVAAPAAAAAAPGAKDETVASLSPLTWPWMGKVGWTLTYVAFLVFIFVVTTYRIPGAEVAIAVALIGLPFIGQRFSMPPFLILMAAFVLWSVLGMTSTSWPKEVQEEVLLLSKLWLIALVAVNALRSPAQIRFFSFVFLGCFMLFPARGAVVNYLGGYNVAGRALWNYIYANPNDLAALALLPLSVGVSLLKTERFRWTRYLTIASVAMLPLLILMTQSRGGFLALVFFGGAFLLGQRKRARTLMVMAALAVAVVAIAPRGVWERVKGLRNVTSTQTLTEADAEGSARQRFEIWRVAVSLIEHNPLTGVGFGAYSRAHEVHQIEGSFARTARGRRDTHSTYLNVAAETGIPGLVFFLGMTIAAVVSADRARRRWRRVLPAEAAGLYALEIGLVAFLIAGVFGSFSRLTFLYLHMAYMYAAARALGEQGAALEGAVGEASRQTREPVRRGARAGVVRAGA